MGIGNGNDPETAAVRTKEDSLPLMGIGNRVTLLNNTFFLPSLPLMGIGNVVFPADSDGGSYLITPHGDWKPRRRVRQVGQRRRNALITPHGDWKLGNRDDPCPTRATGGPTHYPSWGLETWPEELAGRSPHPRCSLPLMGIGNDADNLIESLVATGCSLPLMGIGNANAPKSRRARDGHGAHYPSWGLETFCRRRPCRGLVNPVLITPHGDWKRRSTPRAPGASRGSLITPHGDWKLTDLARSDPTQAVSLPLMGIGNSSPERGWAETKSSTHYPSWGLETRESKFRSLA